jgi:hypothetical protein
MADLASVVVGYRDRSRNSTIRARCFSTTFSAALIMSAT